MPERAQGSIAERTISQRVAPRPKAASCCSTRHGEEHLAA